MTLTPPTPVSPRPVQIPVQDLMAFVHDRVLAQPQPRDQPGDQPSVQPIDQPIDQPSCAPAASADCPVLLDVREAWERQTARFDLPGARSLHIPMGTLPARLHELDRQQPILVLCHHGARSLQCVTFLRRQGFEAAYNVAGGIDAWSREVDGSVPHY